MESVGDGNTQNQPQRCPTPGYLASSACGTSTPPRCAWRSCSHCARAARTWARRSAARVRGSMTTRSLSPLASRMMMTLRSKSRSFTRRRRPSISRMPVPYNKRATRALSGGSAAMRDATSATVRTEGMRLGRRKLPMSHCHAGLDPASMQLGPWIAGAATPDLIRGRNDRRRKVVLLQFPSPLGVRGR